METKRKHNEKKKQEQSRASVSCETAVSGLNICATRPLKGEERGVGVHKIFEEIL